MARSLPPRPNFDQLRIQAKELLKAHHDGDPSACATLRLLRQFSSLGDKEILAARVTLKDAQFALALDHGFSSWDALKRRVTNASPRMSFQHFSDDLRKATYNAQEAARGEVNLGDLLVAIGRDPDTLGNRLLRAVGQIYPIEMPAFACPSKDVQSIGDMTLAAPARQAFEYASLEAQRLRHRFVGSQHLVLGILRVLSEARGHDERDEQRLLIARELAARLPVDSSQMQNADAFEKSVADAGGDPTKWEALQSSAAICRAISWVRRNHAREVIMERVEGVVSLRVLNAGGQHVGEPIVLGSLITPAMEEGARVWLGTAATYLASEEFAAGENRLVLVVTPRDQRSPDTLLRVRIVEIEHTPGESP